MPNYKVVDADQLNADLKMVADAIRAKGETQEELAFPLGYKSAVEEISGGGSDAQYYIELPVQDGSISYTLQSSADKLIINHIYTDFGDGTGLYDIFPLIYINGTLFECTFHGMDIPSHTLPDDLHKYYHWADGGYGEVSEEEAKAIWRAGASIEVRDIASATVTLGSDIEILADMPIVVDFSNGDQSLSVPGGYAVKSAIIKKPETLIPEHILEGVNVAGVIGIYEGEKHTIVNDMNIELDFTDGDQLLNVPEGYAVESAILKKPETLIPENIAKDVDIAGVIGTHEGGGGGTAEGCSTVTFMNGAEVIFTRPVYNGDDCPDPVTQGRIETPLKESTAQYDFTHNGWASADGGTADSSLLKNITEDKTLYAAYSSTVRSYTVTYFDEDGATVLHTEQLSYGSTPSYTPTHQTDPDHYAFDSWSPSLVSVTGDADYTVVWKEKLALSDFTWEELDAMTIEELRANFKVGDTGPYVAGFGSTNLIGFENVELADGSGKAKMVFCINIPLAAYIDWVPYAEWGRGKDWSNCNYRKFANDNFEDKYPSVYEYIKQVKIRYTSTNGTIEEITDRVFAPSLSQFGYTDAPDEGEKFDIYAEKTMEDALEKIDNMNFYILNGCTRTIELSGDNVYCIKIGTAPTVTTRSTTGLPARTCFCI